MTVEDEQPEETTETVDPDTYPAETVRKLRDENASHRTRARDAEAKADDYATRLHAELVRAKGILLDPSDLPFAAEHLEDDEKLTAAINELVQQKPHLKIRRVPFGDIGQGVRGEVAKPQDFSGFFAN